MKCAICRKEMSLKRQQVSETENGPVFEYYYECEECGSIIKKNNTVNNEVSNSHCPKCGSALMQGAMFCSTCGNKIGSTFNSRTKYNISTAIAVIMLIAGVIALFIPCVKVSILGVEDTRSAWQLNIVICCIFLALSLVTFLLVCKGQGTAAAVISFFMCIPGIINAVSIESRLEKLREYKYLDLSKFVTRQAGCFILIIAPIILFIACIVIETSKHELMNRQ